MGGCATKPLVLKDETEAPKPVQEPSVVAEPAKDEAAVTVAGEDQTEAVKADDANGQKSLGNLFEEKEKEEAAAAAEEEKPKEETEAAVAEEKTRPEDQNANDASKDGAGAEEEEKKQ
ncbi:hypothetical protein KSP40_PGU019722 [Platanthera guangdongensis]|uniref:Uncharacterized protein n=1 Tax=Platanthera guangdongensis TaxID=2320717 RepID=A0ABR2MQ99_9ASPA